MKKIISGFILEVVLVLSLGTLLYSALNAPSPAETEQGEDMEHIMWAVSSFIGLISFGVASVGFGLGYVAWFAGFSLPGAQEAPLIRFLATLLIPTALFIGACLLLPITDAHTVLIETYGTFGYLALLVGSAIAGKIAHFVPLSIIYRKKPEQSGPANPSQRDA
jgi:hypothetical protein